MISNLSKSEFKEKLEKFTKVGNPDMKGIPFIFFTIFTQMLKKFYGEFDNSKFRLTENNIYFFSFTPAPLYIIEGKYKANAKNKTNITYRLRPIGTTYLLLHTLLIIFLIPINLELIPQDWNIWGFIIVNLSVILFFLFFIILVRNYSKKQLITDFHRIFEIENENE